MARTVAPHRLRRRRAAAGQRGSHLHPDPSTCLGIASGWSWLHVARSIPTTDFTWCELPYFGQQVGAQQLPSDAAPGFFARTNALTIRPPEAAKRL
jgi:hypothetical protein